ncbi:MAG: DUF3343 domain-containing protein [Tindallia sp. MSAO_Bac2]|nr:MAG: DUF3343 domain-containing protein [Tindallia sp. MSAO_Bac2]
MKREYLLAFHSTHHAIAGEQILKEKDYPVGIIPTPREITASCGLSLRWDAEAIAAGKDEMLKLLQKKHVEWAGLYTRCREEGKNSLWTLAENAEKSLQGDDE